MILNQAVNKSLRDKNIIRERPSNQSSSMASKIPVFKRFGCVSLQIGCIILGILGIIGSIYIIGYSAIQVTKNEERIDAVDEILQTFGRRRRSINFDSAMSAFGEEFKGPKDMTKAQAQAVKKDLKTFYIINIMDLLFGILNLIAYGALLLGSTMMMPMALLPILSLVPFDMFYHFTSAIFIGVETSEYKEIPLFVIGMVTNALFFIAFEVFAWLGVYSFKHELKESSQTSSIQTTS